MYRVRHVYYPGTKEGYKAAKEAAMWVQEAKISQMRKLLKYGYGGLSRYSFSKKRS